MGVGDSRWGRQNRGVSPVIAVILMVAITVILSAVIGTYVLGITDSLNDSPPQVTFDVETGETTLEDISATRHTFTAVNVTLTGGDTIHDGGALSATIDGKPAYAYDSEVMVKTINGGTNDEPVVLKPFEGEFYQDGELSAGETTRLIMKTEWLETRDAETLGSGSDLLRYAYPGPSNGMHTGNRILWQNGNYYAPGNYEIKDGQVLRITWTSSSGQSAVLLEHEINL